MASCKKSERMTNAPLAQTVTPGVKVGEGKDVLEGGGTFLLVVPPSGQECLSHSSSLSDSTVPKFYSGLLSCFYNAVLDKALRYKG